MIMRGKRVLASFPGAEAFPRLDPELKHLVEERLAADAEDLGGFGPIPPGLGQGVLDALFFRPVDGVLLNQRIFKGKADLIDYIISEHNVFPYTIYMICIIEMDGNSLYIGYGDS